MKYFIYILYSEKLDKYYIGISKTPEVRLRYHNLGKKGWTKTGVPWRMVYKKEFESKSDAMKKERFIKKQKSKMFIVKLINGEYNL